MRSYVVVASLSLSVLVVSSIGCSHRVAQGAADAATSEPLPDLATHVPDPPADLAVEASVDLPPPPFMGAVYAHSATELFSIDPQTLAITRVGTFTFNGVPEADPITDIALDKNGDMVGISYETLYAIDRKTAACTRLATIGQTFNALSYVAEDQIDQQGSPEEILIAANLGGEVYQLDPKTGAARLLGSYGDGLTSSGDLVSVKGFGTVATVSRGEGTNDLLARIDLRNGAHATVIGDTGDTAIFGLGFWGDRVFGFTENQRFDTIDVKTGKATLVQKTPQWWWGAGVSTWAPVTIQ